MSGGAVSPVPPVAIPLAADPRNLNYWLYASCCDCSASGTEAMIQGIVNVSRSRNCALGVTGALIFTGSHFAQYLEGPTDAVDIVKASVLADTRHNGIRTIREGSAQARLFGNWSLAYAGHSVAFDRLIVLARRLQGRSAELLLFEMLRKFTGHPLPTLARPASAIDRARGYIIESPDSD